MDPIYSKWVLKIAMGILTGLLAARKNRSFTFWASVGTISLLALCVLAFLPYLCKQCKSNVSAEEAKLGHCLNCMSGVEPSNVPEKEANSNF